MIEIVSIICLVTILILLKWVLNINIKKIKELSKGNKLDELVKRLPKNEEIGQEMLKMLKNENVKIEKSKDEKSGTSLYLVAGNKIIIAEGNRKLCRSANNGTRVLTLCAKQKNVVV